MKTKKNFLNTLSTFSVMYIIYVSLLFNAFANGQNFRETSLPPKRKIGRLKGVHSINLLGNVNYDTHRFKTYCYWKSIGVQACTHKGIKNKIIIFFKR